MQSFPETFFFLQLQKKAMERKYPHYKGTISLCIPAHHNCKKIRINDDDKRRFFLYEQKIKKNPI